MSWLAKELYKRTVPEGYLLFSQTAGYQFSVGGVMSSCVHGANMHESLLATRVTGVRLLSADGTYEWVRDESELRVLRGSLGCFGIITHVQLELQRVTALAASHVDVTMKPTTADVGRACFPSWSGCVCQSHG